MLGDPCLEIKIKKKTKENTHSLSENKTMPEAA